LWVIFAFLDPDPAGQKKCGPFGSGSATLEVYRNTLLLPSHREIIIFFILVFVDVFVSAINIVRGKKILTEVGSVADP
jgi:hypothetical protein